MIEGKTPVNSEMIKWFIKSICTKSIVAFKVSKFTSSLKDLSPYSRIRVTTGSLLFSIILSISLTFFRRVDRPA